MKSFEGMFRRSAARAAMAAAHLVAIAPLAGCLSQVNGEPGRAESAQATFYVDSVTPGEISTTVTDDWNFPRRKIANFKTCLRSRATLAAIPFEQFALSDGETEQMHVTDANGCFAWAEQHDFDYLGAETFLPLARTIRATAANSGAVAVNVAFDPWREGAAGVLDLNYNSAPRLQEGGRLAGFRARVGSPDATSNLDVQSLQLQFLGLDYARYRIDRQLTLSVAHTYRLRMNPIVYRRGMSGNWIAETPRQGRLRITLVLVPEAARKAPRPQDVLARTQVETTIDKGLAWADLDLEFRDLAAITNRVVAFVEVEPLGQGRLRDSLRMTGPMGPLPAVGTTNLVPTPLSAAALVTAAGESAEETSGEQLLERYSGLRDLTAGSPNGAPEGFSTTDAEALLAARPGDAAVDEALRKLCRAAFASDAAELPPAPPRSSPLRAWLDSLRADSAAAEPRSAAEAATRCLRSPRLALRIAPRDLVERILTPTPTRADAGAQTETLEVASTFTRSKTDGESRGVNTSVTASAGISLGASWNPLSFLGANLGLSFGLGANGQWFHTHARGVTSSAAASTVTATRRMSLIAEARTFRFDARVRRCALVAPALATGERPRPDARGFFACGRDSRDLTAEETYYLVTQTSLVPGSPFGDPGAASENPYQMFIRGKTTYALFRALLSDPRTEVVLDAHPRISESLVPDRLDLRMTQEFPGMLSE